MTHITQTTSTAATVGQSSHSAPLFSTENTLQNIFQGHMKKYLCVVQCFSVHRKELTVEARELKGELFCLPCHDKMGVPICGACRRPIEGRVVNAMGKQWHVEVCQHK